MLRRLVIRMIGLAVAGIMLVFAAADPALAGKRVALVVGNSRYQHDRPLANPANDARLVAQALQRSGFELSGGGVQLDLGKAAFDQAVRRFGSAIQGAEVALFYFAGHGLQVNGTNWLVPVDTVYSQPRDLEFVMVDASAVLRQMEGAGTRLNLMLLDACRDNPFLAAGARGGARGLAQMQAPEGTLISYATQPGATAADGNGANSPYADALAAALREPGLELFQMFNRVGVTVRRATGGVQVPWVSSSPIDGQFYLSGVAPGSGSVPPPAVPAPVPVVPGPVVPGPVVPGPVVAAIPVQRQPGATVAPPAAPPVPVRPAVGGGNEMLARAAAARAAGDHAGAVALYRPPADAGDRVAQYELADTLLNWPGPRVDFVEVLRWARRSADQGYGPAQVLVGLFYLNRQGGVARDPDGAMAWFTKAAGAGDGMGMVNIGLMYMEGVGVRKDYAAAMGWFRKATDAGSSAGPANVGKLYQFGWGVPLDYGEALRWYRRAAEGGNVGILMTIGEFLEKGLGGPKDMAAAREVYRQAAAKGVAAAVDRLQRLGN